jgi:hypothetical protein
MPNSVRRLALAATQFILPALSGWLAFELSAREHALDALIGQGACGNLSMLPGAPLFLGHCLQCWSSGLAAGAVTYLVISMVKDFSPAVSPRLRRIP